MITKMLIPSSAEFFNPEYATAMLEYAEGLTKEIEEQIYLGLNINCFRQSIPFAVVCFAKAVHKLFEMGLWEDFVPSPLLIDLSKIDLNDASLYLIQEDSLQPYVPIPQHVVDKYDKSKNN